MELPTTRWLRPGDVSSARSPALFLPPGVPSLVPPCFLSCAQMAILWGHCAGAGEAHVADFVHAGFLQPWRVHPHRAFLLRVHVIHHGHWPRVTQRAILATPSPPWWHGVVDLASNSASPSYVAKTWKPRCCPGWFCRSCVGACFSACRSRASAEGLLSCTGPWSALPVSLQWLSPAVLSTCGESHLFRGAWRELFKWSLVKETVKSCSLQFCQHPSLSCHPCETDRL